MKTKRIPTGKNLHRQVKLPFLKSVAIAVNSLKVRFFRSMITLLSLVLALSFYSYVRMNSIVARAVAQSGDTEAVRCLEIQGYDVSELCAMVAESPKERWILFLSLLVCVVGIVNTQLMAVTERFREIGTMKCLGALDRFILRLFFIEAGLQGLLGAAIGAVLGTGLSWVVSLVRFGFEATRTINSVQVAAVVGGTLVLGFLLSLLGGVYPAIVAARMQPVEAMRGKD